MHTVHTHVTTVGKYSYVTRSTLVLVLGRCKMAESLRTSLTKKGFDEEILTQFEGILFFCLINIKCKQAQSCGLACVYITFVVWNTEHDVDWR